MRRIGYARVSTLEQSTALQISAFSKHGITRIYSESQSSVKRRPVLDSLLKELRAGDTLYVYKLDRLARSMSHFVRIFEQLKAKQVGFKSLTESIETETPQGRLFLQMLGIFAEFERELIRERCLAGQQAARARGKTWGRVAMFTPSEAKKLAKIWRSGVEQKLLADMFGCSVACLRDSIHRAENRGRWKNATTR
jgi:DNA invertase Pin-like site-specific DNA recombinase